MTENDSAYPYNPEIYNEQRGLTKLELISAMCLQGILANSNSFEVSRFRNIYCEEAIEQAKELLKQLEAENE